MIMITIKREGLLIVVQNDRAKKVRKLDSNHNLRFCIVNKVAIIREKSNQLDLQTMSL
jgi:hypothetical protein